MNTNCGTCGTEITTGHLCTTCRKALRARLTAQVAPVVAQAEADKAVSRNAATRALRYAASMGA